MHPVAGHAWGLTITMSLSEHANTVKSAKLACIGVVDWRSQSKSMIMSMSAANNYYDATAFLYYECVLTHSAVLLAEKLQACPSTVESNINGRKQLEGNM